MIGLTKRILDSLLIIESTRKLSNKTLVIFLVEDRCNNQSLTRRPQVSVSTVKEHSFILTPLLVQKTDIHVGGKASRPLDEKGVYIAHWKRMQQLANWFWERWKSEYLAPIQSRQMWQLIC